MSVSFPGSDVLGTPTSTTVPGFDVLFPSTPTASSTASSSPTTTATTTPSALAPTDTYTPSTSTAASTSTQLINEGTPVDLNQPGSTLADGSIVPGDPTGIASAPVSSTDPDWATDAPSSDFDTPVPGFSTLFPSGTEPNAAVNIANAAAAGPSQYQALDNQIQAASDSELLATLGSSGSSTTSDQATAGDPLAGVSSLLAAVSQGYQAGVYGGGTGTSFDTTA